MKSPFTGGKVVLKKEPRKLFVRKEEVEIIYHYYLCEDTGEQYTDEKLDSLNYFQANNKYREMFSYPFPDEIKSIRKKYGLNAKKMSEVLGFGTNMYRNYESGELPSLSNAKLITLAKDPSLFKTLLEKSNAFEGETFKKNIEKVTGKIIEENKLHFEISFKRYLLGDLIPSSFTGYKKPSLKKLTEMVVFFSQEKPWKTALNKLLFYSDFLNYKNSAYSISGVSYKAIDLGPVPINFQSIFEYLENNKEIEIERKEFRNNIGERFCPIVNRPFNPDIFSKEELDSLNTVLKRFKDIKSSTKEIIKLSHEEKAWLKNYEDRNLIDYQDSFYLKAF